MDARIGSARRRTLVGLSLAVAFVPVLLGITACLESDTPIGDPEKGWVDPRVTGAWLVMGTDQPQLYQGQLWLFEPYDSRTWLVTTVEFRDTGSSADTEARPAAADGATPPAADAMATPSTAGTPGPSAAPPPIDVPHILESLKEERAEANGILVFKAWLTSIGAYRYLVLEFKTALSEKGGLAPHVWLVYRLALKGDRMELTGISDSDFKNAKTRGEAEQILAQRAAEPGYFDGSESGVLYRIPRSRYDDVGNILSRAGLGHW